MTAGSRVPGFLRVSAVRTVIIVFGYTCIFLLAYWPVLHSRSDFTDSYTILDWSNRDRWRWFSSQLISFGRPIYLGMLRVAFIAVHDIDGLRLLRILSVAGLVLLAFVSYRALAMAKVPRGLAIALPAVVYTLPSFQVWAAWGICFPFAFGGVLAVLACLSATMALRPGVSPRQRLLRVVVAFALLTAAAAIYQPSWSLFIPYALIFLMDRSAQREGSSVRFVTRCAMYVGIALAAIAADAGIARGLSIALYGTPSPVDPTRTSFTTDIAGKFAWFIQQPFLGSAHLWQIGDDGWFLPTLVAALLVGGQWAAYGSSLTLALRNGSLVLGAAVLSCLPNLVIVESWASYRTRAGLATTVALLTCLALAAIVRRLMAAIQPRGKLRPGERSRGVVVIGVVVALAAWGAASAHVSVATYFSEPQTKEVNFIERQLRANLTATTTEIDIRACSWQDSLAPTTVYDEFGIPSCSKSWVPAAQVRVLLRSFAGPRSAIPVNLVDAPEPSTAGRMFIDMRDLCCK